MPGTRVLRYLLAVAETGHFGKAAEQCNVSASTLSGQLRRFEIYLGTQLFERTPTGARLTGAGMRILPWAEMALYATERLREAARE